tara:strand:- start:342 stop:611 length:270 start_codon:yes stop_codon:yes gene_type:complete
MAYRVNYQTRSVLNNIDALNVNIRKQTETLRLLQAEWAYLNRPNRLRVLVEKHFSYLELVPLRADQIVDLKDLADLHFLKEERTSAMFD